MYPHAKCLLLPRKAAVYGQDYLSENIRLSLNLVPVYPDDAGRYSGLEYLQNVRLVVSQNPDNLADAVCFEELPDEIPKLIHVHLQPSYLDQKCREYLRRSATRSRLGISPAEFHRRELAEMYGNIDWHTVYNGCDETLFCPSSDAQRSSFKLKHSIREDQFVIACVGRLENAKGLQIIEELAMRLDGDMCLLLQYMYRDKNKVTQTFRDAARKIQKLRPDVVRIIEDDGNVKEKYMRYSDLLVSPSLCEVAPMVVVEALMCGVPVLATDSTPFLREELGGLILPENSLRLASLPDRIRTSERAKLILDKVEVDQVVAAILRGIKESSSHRAVLGAERDRLASAMRETAFTQSAMLRNISELYDGVMPRR